MRQVTTMPVEPVNLKKHSLLLISAESKDPYSFAISGLDLPKVIHSPNSKGMDRATLHDAEGLRSLEQAGFKLYVINQEDFRDLCVMCVASLTELDFADNYKKWLAGKNRHELTTITQD
jgi:hypothetical protein